jgi:hypothetical protein
VLGREGKVHYSCLSIHQINQNQNDFYFYFFCFWNHIRKSHCKGQKTQSPGQDPRDTTPTGTQRAGKNKSLVLCVNEIHDRYNSFCESPPSNFITGITPCLCAILCNCVVVLQRRTHIHKHVVGAATTTIYKGTNIYEFKHGITTLVQQQYYQEATTTSKHNIERASLFFLTKIKATSKHKILQELLCFS